MSLKVDEIVEGIVARKLTGSDALGAFENLSEEERKRLLLKLKAAIPVITITGSTAEVESDSKWKLRAVDETELDDTHLEFIGNFSREYGELVPRSKQLILQYQQWFVDQRRPFHLLKELKDMHFQITYQKAEGAYITDIDGNVYIDISGDMGVNIFGHKPEWLTGALNEALNRGIPIVGYSEMILKTSQLFCEITGHERMLFTQSGTEAVMFAVRIARAATQRKKIVIFDGSFHGLSDAVVAMRGRMGESIPMGPGMLREFAEQLIVLDYGEPEALDTIDRRADEIAGVLVEPVQSRHPYRKPVEFLKDLRKLTLEKDIPFIMDEMITGFRICPRGAQGHFGVAADIATYGKIPGGGLPTGIVAGSARYMDFVDGGTWNFGDDSMPRQLRTGMAGTHTQNPLKVAATYAVLKEIARTGTAKGSSCTDCQCFQRDLNEKTSRLAGKLNSYCRRRRLPIKVDYFGSLFRFRFLDVMWGITEALFFLLLRKNSVETNIQGNCFLTTAHSDEDIDRIEDCVKRSLDTLARHNFFVVEEYYDKSGDEQEDKPKAGVGGEKEEHTEMVQDKAIADFKSSLRRELETIIR